MGMVKLLSESLLELGFFSALGTCEFPGGDYNPEYVGGGTPQTWDENNGVMVIYDEEGRPWITCSRKLDECVMGILDTMKAQHNLRRGAGVPHSNDGGYFVNKILPTLMKS